MGQWWESFPWREIQTNLREIDMKDISAAQVVQDLQSFHANVLMINAAGIIASYPTELPFHYQSPYLTGDSLADIIEACHEAGIRVVARTDFSKVRRPIYEQHPEWAYISPKGQIIDYLGDIAVCLNGNYQQKYSLQIMEECLTKLPFDGIFFNMGGYQTRDYSGNYYGPCQCENCQRKFDQMFGLSLPKTEDMEDPVYRKYVQFKNATLRAHHEKVYNFISSRWPHVAIANHREFGKGFIRQESNTAIERPLPHWQYNASDNTKWATTNYPDMVSSNTTVDFIDFPYRHVAVSPYQQSLRLVQSLANGGALDYYLIGRLDNHEDRSGYEEIRRIFAYHAAHEADYGPRTSKATVAVLHGPQGNIGEFRGWFRVLAENHFLFDTVLDATALELPWDKYQAIVLPDFQGISDALAARLDDFVAAGGTLIASGRAGLRDEHWEPRAEPVLKSLGIAHLQHVRENMRAAYFKFEDKEGFPRMAESDLVYVDGFYVYADYVEGAQPRMKLVPPQPFGPPERTYSHLPLTDHPGFVVNRHGEGKAIYVPWLPGALFHRQGYPNTSEFMADLLEHVAQIEPVGGNLSPMVEVTHFTSRDGEFDLVHLVNGSGHYGVSFFAPLPMQDLEVSVAYPQQPQHVRSLVTGEERDHSWQEGWLTVRVPRLDLFEALRIE